MKVMDFSEPSRRKAVKRFYRLVRMDLCERNVDWCLVLLGAGVVIAETVAFKTGN
jgi:hypothetical protein